MKVDLTPPQAMNVINCKSPDGTMTLSGVRQRGAQVRRAHGVPAVQELPRADGPLFARRAQLRPDRQLPDDGRGAAGPIDPTVTFVRESPLAPQKVTGAQPFAQAARGERRDSRVRRAEGRQLRDRRHDPDLQHLRAQRSSVADERHDHVAVQDASPWPISCARAREVRSERPTSSRGERFCGRAAGRRSCSRRSCGRSKRAPRG